MNGSYNANVFVVRLRGLPWNTTQSEIQTFLQGCQIRQTQFVTNDQGRPTGECFLALESKEDMDRAKTFDKKMMANRYIEVFESSAQEMSHMTNKNHKSDDSSTAPDNTANNDQWREPVIRLRGLPYNSSKEDVTSFFTGLDIAQNGVHISSSKPAGEAFVAFTNMDNALRALDFNRKNMGHRYIEIFKSNYADARASIMNDSQSMPRQKSNNAPPQYQQQESYNNNMGNGYNNNMPQYGDEPRSNGYNSYNGPESNYPMNSSNGSNKRSMPVSFTIKMRGVPFEAAQKEIFEFFSPVVPIRLDQENTPRGKPPIWFAEFGSREEATEAMTFHKNYMGTRYIELLPLYDELERTKMLRT